MRIIKKYWKQGVGLLLLCCMTVVAMGYGNGTFDLSFADRTPISGTNDGGDATPPAWQLPEGESGGVPPQTAAEALASFDSLYEAIAEGRKQTALAYGTSDVYFTVGTPAGARELPFSLRLTSVAREVRVPLPDSGAGYRSELRFLTVEKPVYSVYMGYILYENGEDVRLLSGTGALLLTDFRLEPAFARDSLGRPLFRAAQTETYYCYDETTGEMRQTALDRSVLPLASGVDYAAPVETPYVRFQDADGKWGYRLRNTGAVVIAPKYDTAFDFRPNSDPTEDRAEYAYLAVVFMEGGSLRIINCAGDTVIETVNLREYSFTEGGTIGSFDVREGCELPERTETIGALGMDGIDAHGIVRVRRRMVRVTNPDVIPMDTDVLLQIRRNGDDFGYLYRFLEIPAGYRLCAYSEGVMLLQDLARNTYGYYSYDGNWIVAPEFVEASPMREGVAAVRLADGNMGLLRADGSWALAPLFDYVSPCADGTVTVYDATTGWRLLCKMKG